MKYILTILSVAAACYAEEPPFDWLSKEIAANSTQITALSAYYSTFTCTEFSDQDWRSVADQCKSVCVPKRADGLEPDWEEGRWVEGSVSCLGLGDWYSFRTGLRSDDPNIKRVRAGHCECNLAIVEELGDFFIEGSYRAAMAIIDAIKQLGCFLLQAIDLLIQIGELAIPPPGKAITTGMRTAIASAKAYRYAYEGQDAARNWAEFMLEMVGGQGVDLAGKAGCPSVPTISDLIKSFLPLANSRPDIYEDFSTIPGGPGCMGKGKKGDTKKCSNEEDNGNDNNGNDNNGGQTRAEEPKTSVPATSAQNTDNPSPTPTEEAKSTTQASATQKTDTPGSSAAEDPKTSSQASSSTQNADNPTSAATGDSRTSDTVSSTQSSTQSSTPSATPSSNPSSIQPSTPSSTQSSTQSSTASTSTISSRCTYYKPKATNQRVMMKREYSDFLRDVDDGKGTMKKIAAVARETGVDVA